MKLLMVILMLITILYAEQQYGVNDVYEDSNSKIWLEKRTNKIANGFVSGMMSNGYSKKFYIKNGKIEGLFQFYTEKGPRITSTYVNGLEHGVSIYYNWDVPYQISSKINFVNGKRHGLSYEYNDDKSLSGIYNFKNGRYHGIQKKFYKSGNLEKVTKYNNGVKITRKIFYETGELEADMKFIGSKTIARLFYKNKNLKSEIEMNSAIKNIKVITYDKNKNKEYEISGDPDDELIGYKYYKNIKSKMNYAQTLNFFNSSEWMEGEK